ncbi:MAG: thioredoxin family protein [Chthoniobacterales bacterium]
MKFKHSLVGWLSIGLLCIACGAKKSAPVSEAPVTEQKPPADEKLHWLTDYDAAKAQARSENRMLLMLFTGSDWCPPCRALEKDLFSKPEFAQYAAKLLVLLEVDFPRRKPISAEQRAANAKVAGAYGVEGFPTVIVLAFDSKPLGKFGYVPGLTPDKVIDALEKARTEK